jgi:hypothetical protein
MRDKVLEHRSMELKFIKQQPAMCILQKWMKNFQETSRMLTALQHLWKNELQFMYCPVVFCLNLA